MDLSTYLASLKRFAWVLIIVPILVGAGTAVWTVHETPSLHSGTVSVALPVSTGAQSVIDEITADFTYAASTPQVQDSVAQKAGITRNTLKSGLHVSQAGVDGAYMKITYNSKVLSRAQSIPPDLAYQALAYVLNPRIESAKTLQQNIAKESTAVTAKQNAILNRAKSGAANAGLAALRIAAAKGTPAYTALSIQQNQLLTQENQAATTVQTYTSDLATAQTAQQSSVAALDTTSVTKTAVTRAVANGAAALLLLLLLLVVIELLSGRKPVATAPTSHRATDAEGSPALPTVTPAAPSRVAPATRAKAAAAEPPAPATTPAAPAETMPEDEIESPTTTSGRAGRATTSLRRSQK